MTCFYGEVLGLKQIATEKGWREFAAGGAAIALHSGPSSSGRKGPKDRLPRQRRRGSTRNISLTRRKLRQSQARRHLLSLRRQRPRRQSHSIVQPLIFGRRNSSP